MKKIFVSCLLLVLWTEQAFALPAEIRVIPDWDRIPVKVIHRIYQDSEGYMWFGTFGGLFRYDGYNYKPYRSDLNTPGLLDNNYITNIIEDKAGRLWIGTVGGLYRLDKQTDKIEKIDIGSDSSANIFTLSTTPNGLVWASISGKLYAFDIEGTLKETYTIPKNAGTYFVYETQKKETIISVEWQGMFLLKGGQLVPYHHDERYRCLEQIVWDEVLGCYWLATWGNGVLKFMPEAGVDDEKYIPQPLSVSIKGEPISKLYHMVLDKDRSMWITGWNGICCMNISSDGNLEQNAEVFRRLQTDNTVTSLLNSQLYDIVADHQGNLWVSSLDSKSFVITRDDNQTDNQTGMWQLLSKISADFGCAPSINTLCIDGNGTLWMNQERHGFVLRNLNDAEAGTEICPWSRVEGMYIEPNLLVKSLDKDCVWAMNTWGSRFCKLRYDGNRIYLAGNWSINDNSKQGLKINDLLQLSQSLVMIATDRGLIEYNLQNGSK